MKKEICQKYAKLLTHYCLSLKKNQKVLVRSTYLAEPLLQELQAEILQAGALLETQISFKDQNKGYYLNTPEEMIEENPTFYKLALETFDAIVTIDAPFDTRELKDIDTVKKLNRAKALAPIKNIFMDRSASGKLNWVICEYPTKAGAKEANMSLEEFSTFITEACFLQHADPVKEWNKISKMQESIVKKLNADDSIRFVGPSGTDISFSTKGRSWINSDGHHNMPSGEVFTSPVEDSGNGVVYFSYPTLYQGQEVEGVTLTVKDGYVEKWEAKIGKTALDQAFAIPGSRYFGEIAIGTNTQIQKATRNILFDEKIGGSIHMAVGASYKEAGGKNESSLHWDMITDMKNGGKIYLNDELIYKNGAFV